MCPLPDKRKAAGRIATQRHIVAESFTQFINLDWLFRLPIPIRIFGRAVILPEPARNRIAVEHFPNDHRVKLRDGLGGNFARILDRKSVVCDRVCTYVWISVVAVSLKK